MKKFLNWLKSPSSDYILFLCVILLANIVGYNSYKRFDLTSAKSYSLSKESKSLVKNLQEPLSVRVFFDDNLPAQYESVAQYVKDILVEYKGSGNKNFTVAYMDMSKPENETLARNYGLHQIQIQEVKNKEVGFKQGYMGVVITYGDTIDTIDPITNVEGFEYTLTSKMSKMISTADALTGLKNGEKVKLTLYLSDSLKNMRISGVNQIEKILGDIVFELNKKNYNRIEFVIQNPDSETAQALFPKYGFKAISFTDTDGSKKYAALGLVLEYNDDFRVIPLELQNAIFTYAIAGLDEADANITQGLQSLFSHVTSIGYITGHSELDHADANVALVFSNLISDNYQLVDLDLTKDEIPYGVNSIIINGPKSDFLEEELYKIDQFVMRGGNVLFFIDSVVENQYAQYTGGEPYNPNELNIERLLNAYGVTRKNGVVMDKNCHSQANRQFGKVDLYWIPVLQKPQLAKKHPVTSNLGYVYMMLNGALDVSQAVENKNVKTTVLAKSSPESWIQESEIILHPVYLNPPAKEEMKSENLAVMLEGKFNSAFENGLEVDNASGNLELSSHLSASVLPAKIFVVGSSSITTAQLMDESGSSPIAMFLLNTVDYMNGKPELCRMRTKGLSIDTLHVANGVAVTFWQFFNQFGLTILVVIAGIVVWRCRVKRRKAINAKYNPNDTRTINKKEEKKNEN